jgi:hypothetical protein
LVLELILQLKGLTFTELGVVEKLHQGIERVIEGMGWTAWAKQCWEHRDLLYAQERNFVMQMLSVEKPSAKQLLWLARINRALKERFEEAANPVRKKPKKPTPQEESGE